MLYEVLAQTFDKIENESSNLEKTQIYADLIKESPAELIGKILALTTTRFQPDWKGEPELGIAERMAVQIVAKAASLSEDDVYASLRSTGDLGLTGEKLLAGGGGQASLFPQELTVSKVHDTLMKVSRLTGPGSSKQKVSLLVGILNDAKPIEVRYILRTLTRTMRLGLGYMSIMDALSIAYAGDRTLRPQIERAFNLCSDLQRVAEILANEGKEGLEHVHVEVGIPIMMMAAKKLTSSQEILEKVGGRAFVEYKYDGERVQVHKKGTDIVLFSRRQEVITQQYPDVVEYVRESVKPITCVLEGECIAIDPESRRTRPFQELMRRKRKTGIEEMINEIPVVMRFFDILYIDGEDVTGKPMLERRALLENAIVEGENVGLTRGEVVTAPEEIDRIFSEAISDGQEGIIAKAVHDDSVYQAGSRSWLWIKLKSSYQEGKSDSVDLVVVGAMYGKGKRTGVYGTILASAYDPVKDSYPTVCKIGTGFTDDVLQEFKERLDPLKLENKDPKVESDLEADVWFKPQIVIEVIGDELTLSPTHIAGRDQLNQGGLAIRFPRFTGRWRDDKDSTQATTVAELIDMFHSQRVRNT